MKTNKLINILLSSVLVAFAFNSCTSDFEDINTNKRVLATVDASTIGNVFAYAEYNGLLYGGGSWQIAENLFADLYVQYYSDWQTKFQTDRHNQNTDWSGAAWDIFYGGAAKDLQVVFQVTKANDMIAQYAIAQIYKVLVYQQITDYWGPIPYSQVNNGEKSVAYDSQETIYRDFFVQLDSATTTLASHLTETPYGNNDQIYKGNVSKWITFANTLRLRIAMRMSYIDPTTAKTQAEKAVAAGVMETNDDNAIMSVNNNSYNPLPLMCPWNEFRMSATMESIMKGLQDPRILDYWSPAVNTGLITGMRNGLSVPEISTPEHQYNNLSTLAPRWSNNANQGITPWEVMKASEAWFLRAEGALNGWNMGTTAEDAYNTGIQVALKYWGKSDADIAAYQAGTTTPIALPDFSTPPQSDIIVSWSAADPSRHLEQIQTQKWLALFPNGWEAWSENRRTEFPTLIPVVHSDDPEVPPADLMRRIIYGPNEYNNNHDAVTQAVSTMLGGPDVSQTRLWWNPAK
jgi:Susd and RagB outer membrane lipoprotein